MTTHYEKALKIAQALNRRAPGTIVVKARAVGKDAQIEFSGGRTGAAALWLSTSTIDRIEAHFAGYCVTNGGTLHQRDFSVGQRVGIPSKSSRSGARDGRIVEATHARVLVRFSYNSGKVAQRWFPKWETF